MNAYENKNKAFAIGARQALLMLLDSLEKWLGISPTTAEIRKVYKNR